MKLPDNLRYSKEHEWVRQDGDFVYVGITDYAQDQLSDVVFLDVDTEGETLSKDEIFGSVEAVKTVSDLFMPISGEIVEVNEELEDNAQYVNDDPYEKGWMIKIKPSDTSEIENLMTASDYKSFTENLG